MAISRYMAVAKDETKSNNYPCSVKDKEGNLWVFYQSFEERPEGKGDYIAGRCFDGDEWGKERILSTGGLAYKPSCARDAQGRIWVVWSEAQNGGFNIQAIVQEAGQWSSVYTLTDTNADFLPHISADPQGGVSIVWSSFRNGQSQIYVTDVSLSSTSAITDTAAGQTGLNMSEAQVLAGPEHVVESYRPCCLYDGNGTLHVVYDAFDRQQVRYDIYYTTRGRNGAFTEPVILNDRQYNIWHSAPVLAVNAQNEVYAAWEGHGNWYYLCYYFSILKDGKSMKTEKLFSHLFDTHSISLFVDDEQKLWAAYNVARMFVCVQYRDGDQWSEQRVIGYDWGVSRRPLVAQDKYGDYWFMAQANLIGGGNTNQRNAYIYARYLRKIEFSTIRNLPEPKRTLRLKMGLTEIGEPTSTQEEVLLPPSFEEEALHEIRSTRGNRERVRMTDGEYSLYWGDPHSHSVLSDGNKTIDMLYNYQKYVAKMDFGAVTDHTEYPDKLTDSEYELLKVFNRLKEDDTFKPLHAFEWTSNEWMWNYGHKNVYFPHADVPIMRTSDRRYNRPDKLYEAVAEYGGLVPAHHPSGQWSNIFTGIQYSAYNDWSYYGGDHEAVVEICSHWGVFEYYGNEGKMKAEIPDNHVRDALNRGYKLGFIGGTDTHGGTPGQEFGITGVWLKNLSQADIIAAMKERRTLASQGPKLAVLFRLNGLPAGSAVRDAETRTIRITVQAPEFEEEISTVTLVKNGEEIRRFSVDGKNADFTYTEPGGTGGNDYYYVRVTMSSGLRVWASPIWVEGADR